MLTTKLIVSHRKAIIFCIGFVLTFVMLNLIQDIVRSNLKNSAFYFSESFMFSSFWWLFAPFFFSQYFVVKQHKYKASLFFQIAVIALPIVAHLFTFPFLVWLLSKTFYYHTYAIQQTFRYTMSEHLYLLILLYTIPVLAFRYFTGKTKQAEMISQTPEKSLSNKFISSILVSDGNKKHSIAVSDIFYYSANPPYIDINLDGKRYLHKETLRSVSLKSDPAQFVRIHRSAIVNINMVNSYTTRLNGDYDLTLKNNVQLRVSRNYAADFKALFSQTHQLATK